MYGLSSAGAAAGAGTYGASGPLDMQIASARRRTLSRGDTIYQPGLPEIVGYVISGVVKLVTLSSDGRSNIIALVEAPGFFGRVFGVSAEYTIEAASDVVLACFDRNAFECEIAKSPQLEHRIHLENLHQLDAAHERIAVLACQTMIERIATYLVLRLLAAEASTSPNSPAANVIQVPINRRDFAAYLGTTVETVSRNIQALVRRGTISIIDSANIRLLRRRDLFSIARQDENDLLDHVRSRTRNVPDRGAVLSVKPGQLPTADTRAAAQDYLVAAE